MLIRILGLALACNVPDARTVWAFRELLKDHKLAQALFDRLTQALAVLGVELKSGQIIGATFVHVPIQRNSRQDNALVKAGAIPIERWQDNTPKLAHERAYKGNTFSETQKLSNRKKTKTTASTPRSRRPRLAQSLDRARF